MDITNRSEILDIIRRFYQELMKDELLGELFQAEVSDHLEEHLERISDFWVFNLLHIGSYRTDMLTPHLKTHDRWNIDEEKLAQWLVLFDEAIDDKHTGPIAQKMKNNARGIGAVILSKINRMGDPKSLI